jgi:hypothetical protein
MSRDMENVISNSRIGVDSTLQMNCCVLSSDVKSSRGSSKRRCSVEIFSVETVASEFQPLSGLEGAQEMLEQEISHLKE